MYGKPDKSGHLSGIVRFSIHFFVNSVNCFVNCFVNSVNSVNC